MQVRVLTPVAVGLAGRRPQPRPLPVAHHGVRHVDGFVAEPSQAPREFDVVAAGPERLVEATGRFEDGRPHPAVGAGGEGPEARPRREPVRAHEPGPQPRLVVEVATVEGAADHVMALQGAAQGGDPAGGHLVVGVAEQDAVAPGGPGPHVPGVAHAGHAGGVDDAQAGHPVAPRRHHLGQPVGRAVVGDHDLPRPVDLLDGQRGQLAGQDVGRVPHRDDHRDHEPSGAAPASPSCRHSRG